MSGANSMLDDHDRIGSFLQHIRAGCDVSASCKVTRIPRSSFYEWMERATRLRADTPPDEWSTHDHKVVAFADSYELAKAQSVTSLELVIAQAARADWRAAKEMLKRIHPDKWSDRAHLQLEGPNGGPVQVTAVPTFDFTDADAAIEVWRHRAEMGDPQAAALVAAYDGAADDGADG